MTFQSVSDGGDTDIGLRSCMVLHRSEIGFVESLITKRKDDIELTE